MKSYFTLLFSIVLLTSYAQKNSSFTSEQWLKKGNVLLSVGIGIGSPYYPGSYGMVVPPLSLSADYLTTIKGDPINGKLGIGGILAFGSSGYHNYNNVFGTKYDYSFTYTYFLAGARVNYHILLADKVDLYGGLMAGLRFASYSYSGDPLFNNYNGWGGSGVNFVAGVYVGARYFFTNNFGLFGELGYNISWLTLGATFKF